MTRPLDAHGHRRPVRPDRPLSRPAPRPRKASISQAPCPTGSACYRRAILDEWAAEGEALEHLVHHILVHEVGHHFGLSDEDMHALEDEA